MSLDRLDTFAAITVLEYIGRSGGMDGEAPGTARKSLRGVTVGPTRWEGYRPEWIFTGELRSQRVMVRYRLACADHGQG
jgi:hypothetical protein